MHSHNKDFYMFGINLFSWMAVCVCKNPTMYQVFNKHPWSATRRVDSTSLADMTINFSLFCYLINANE